MENKIFDIYYFGLIFLLMFTIYRCHKNNIEKFTFSENSVPKVAVYGCNFGNFRGELDKGIDKIIFDPKIDYYFFTDNEKMETKNWKKVIYNKVKGDNIMDSNRWSSKNVKFNLPDVLKKYDIIVWYDSKIVNKELVEMLNYNEII